MTDETPTPTARIKRIEVVGLFGLYDHVIDLNLEDRVTILHGPNGVGKTVLLKMIKAVLRSSTEELAAVPFQCFHIDFTGDTSSIDVTATTETKPYHSLNGPKTRTTKQLLIKDGDASSTCSYLRRMISPSSKAFMDAGTPTDPARLFPETRWIADEANPSPLNPFTERPNVYLIEAQRTLRSLARFPVEDGTSPPLHPAVWGDALHLQRKISDLHRTYGAKSQNLDQSFPNRLLQRSLRSLNLHELKSRMSAIEGRRAALQDSGILGETSATPFNVTSLDGLSPAQNEVMTLYVEDNEEKLAIFGDLLSRFDLLRRILNRRFRNKSIRADRRHGLVVLDHRNQPLELRALSSGEQQQIVLAYALLFRVPANALVLIDEPELSLHVLWQKRFLPDLLDIVKVANIDVLIATHSPFIVGDRSDLMVALDAEIDHDEPLQS